VVALDYRIGKIEKILKQKEYKITYARKEIIKLFVYNNNVHYMPEEIYELVKNKNISLPTVYRTIEILKSNGIIEETIIDKKRYYELEIFSKKSIHVHLKCIKCGNVFDYLDTKSTLFLLDEKNRIEMKYDMEVNNIYTIFYGFCRECRR